MHPTFKEDEKMSTFAEKLKAARTAAGMTQQGMADRMLIPRRTIQDWEAEKRIPPEYVQRFVLNELAELQKLKEK
jgi:transcriptional regulator with XRE-family HTH domain